MGSIQTPLPAKLIVGFIFQERAVFEKAVLLLVRQFGKTDFQSEFLEFVYTDYYKAEFGSNLKRAFVSFKRLLPQERIATVKRATNAIEKRFSVRGTRRINIDPGYLDLGRLVLATTKDHCHRIYLAKGIYAEITLVFRGKTFSPWPWTYPDYRTPEYISTFNRIRAIYYEQISST